MKKTLTLSLVMFTSPCFAEEVTLYNENGVSLSYSYEKIGTIKDQDCPDLLFDEYQVSAKVQNSNNKAIKLDDKSWFVHRIAFKSYICNKLGQLTSGVSNYFPGIFLDHRRYFTQTPNTGFGAVHSYFLDPKDVDTSLPTVIRVPNGEPLAKPEWYFPEWIFFDVPNQNVAPKNITTTNKTVTQPTNTKESYEKLIVGKWGSKLEDSLHEFIVDGTGFKSSLEPSYIPRSAFKWSISNNVLTLVFPPDRFSKSDFIVKYKILKIDKNKLAILFEANGAPPDKREYFRVND
ncbi:hypothetical protein KTI63_02410 [Acinetobacter guillouiae]|uniref:hypothetical protein n=1 Tax=Acinetobacter guillouiae TaxID=106649 RepID=UPI0021CED901|nr:hypothetical protein [Acinetobacter guillouiae]MCU4491319.1 hypothetical protein [Acinetobacter guillouiae]